MAWIESDTNQKVEVVDGERIQDACEDLGVPFGCRSGCCGTCETEVISGLENLSERTESENEFGLEDNFRLMCQCTVKQGTVTIRV